MKILFVDLDGTIREPLSGERFISHPRDQKIIKGADKAIAHYKALGYEIIGAINQAGVAAGHKSLDDCIEEQYYTMQLFPELEWVLFCPDFEGNQCWACYWSSPPNNKGFFDVTREFPDLKGSYRKPGSGMIQYWMQHQSWLLKTTINPQDCWMIGDRDTDEQAATNAGVGFIPADIWRERWAHIYQV